MKKKKDIKQEEIKPLTREEFESDMKRYIGMFVETIQDDLRFLRDSVRSLNEAIDRINITLDRHETKLWEHENKINHLMSSK